MSHGLDAIRLSLFRVTYDIMTHAHFKIDKPAIFHPAKWAV